MKQKLALARELRHKPTPAERHAWSLLRNRRLLGLKFRRQHVLHGFIVDFYCPSLKLVVELDGKPHADTQQVEYDAARTAWLSEAGYRIIRIRNSDLAAARLRELILGSTPPLVPPLPKGEGVRG